MHNLKFHAIAVSVIMTLIIILYVALSSGSEQPVQVQEPEVRTDRYIEITRATWGRNCDELVNNYTERFYKMRIAMPKGMEKVKDNNVLLELSKICNNQLTCTFTVTDDQLGKIEGLEECPKQLDAQYRCFSWDKARFASFSAYEQASISCDIP